MPAGLDGNPDPVVSECRDAVLASVANVVLDRGVERTAVAIDGRSGAGKSTFADELAARIRGAGRQVVRSTTDSFHRPRAERLRLGPTSADGYYLESHQLDVIVGELLEPFARGASQVLVAAFDEPTDTEDRRASEVDPEAVLIFDGLFLQRPELVRFWDVVVFLEASDRTDRDWVQFLLDDLPDDPVGIAATIDQRLERARWPRYRRGWTVYADAVRPSAGAAIVIDNNDFANPRITRVGEAKGQRP